MLFYSTALPLSSQAIMTFTLSGNGGSTGADNGGFYPAVPTVGYPAHRAASGNLWS